MTPSQLDNMRRAKVLAGLIVQSYRDAAPAGCDPQNIEGWAVGVAAVAAAGVTAYSAYSKEQAQKSQDEALSHQPGVVPYVPVDPTTSFQNYETYRDKVLPQANEDAQQQDDYNNAAFQARLSKTSPSLLSGISQQGTDAAALERGVIPKDVAAQVNRTSAFQSLSGGYAGSGASHALDARDLGLTSLDLQGRGSAMLGANLANTAAVNPYNTTGDSTILSANQFLGRDDQNDAIANATANKNKQIQFQNSLYANAASNINPVSGAIVSGIGSLASSYASGGASSFGGLAGGGGGGGLGDSYDTNTANASMGGGYNPWLDTNNYDTQGNFIGNANSYSGG